MNKFVSRDPLVSVIIPAFNAEQYEVFNLEEDPQETNNLVNASTEVITEMQHRLAAWVQYQNRLMEKLISEVPSQ